MGLVIVMFGTGSPLIGLLPNEGLRRLVTGFLFGTTGGSIALYKTGAPKLGVTGAVSLWFALLQLSLFTVICFYITEVKKGDAMVVNITDATKIERKKSNHPFPRHADMDVTAMVPGLTTEAEGVGNAKGQLDAAKVSFYPDTFSVEVAEEQQILANKAAAGAAQSTADTAVSAAGAAQSTANAGVAQATAAQSSANKAQKSANTAQASADLATAGAIVDADAISKVNQRVSDLGDYKTVAEAGIFFASDSSTLDAAAKADLDTVAQALAGNDGYMIEVAGYTSSTGSKPMNQKLSEDRAAAVTNYLRQKGNVPMRRFLVPAGYGKSNPLAENKDAEGRSFNRRVDVKVLVNKGLEENM